MCMIMQALKRSANSNVYKQEGDMQTKGVLLVYGNIHRQSDLIYPLTFILDEITDKVRELD